MASGISNVIKVLKVWLEPDLYEMVLRIYLPILFPLTFVITLVSLKVDEWLGWSPLLDVPTRMVLAAVLFGAGFSIWTISYAQLVYDGDGSPAPVVRRTQRLVKTGIYSWCRNPSIHGKLLGFLSVGVWVGSTSFIFVLAPLLLVGSLAEKVIRQEPQLIDVFGSEYDVYRREVPLFVPRLSTIIGSITGRG